ncbi:class A beta-lactamase [Paraburkholderia sp. CNPSo 3076]|uniref:class A beta-lactamase n=1 Tax=Paraburkholderia sp. CNPSo 3076 TaxID=2940936 RepID=UPI003A522030
MTVLGGAIAGIASQAFGATVGTAPEADATPAGAADKQFAAIEAQAGGRLGVAMLDTASGDARGWRMHERFPMCSTFKVLLVSAVLTRKDHGKEDLARKVVYSPAQVVSYSPVSGPRAGGEGMTVAELCEAALTRSDNTAANLLLESIGGPSAITAFARSIGDPVTRLDRNETTLNEAIPGDPRDTTTPAAMVANLRELLLGERLSAASREQLIAWLVANKTGDARLRAGLPKDWRVGDKTGTGDRGTANDVAIVWPTGRAPILVTTYLTGATHASSAQRDAAIARVGVWVAGL